MHWPTSSAAPAPKRKDGNVTRAALAVAVGLLSALPAAAQDGAALYTAHCTRCHDGGSPRVPSRTALAQLAPERIVSSLESGTMHAQGASLADGERRAIAVFISGRALGSLAPAPPAPTCADATTPFKIPAQQASWNGWGAGAANNRFQTAAGAGLTPAQIPTLQMKWAFGFAGDLMAAAQPAVIGTRVFVGSTSGRVFALNLRTGCTYWTFDADTMVRTAISVGEGGGRVLAHFGDVRANVYAIDASSGTLVWKRKVDEHLTARITGAPTLHAGRLYVPVSSTEEVAGASPQYECCTFRGSVVALDAATGSVLWKTYTIPEPPKPTRTNKVGKQLYGPSGAAVWSSPTIDTKAGVLYVSTGDSYSDPTAATSDAILALDLNTGAVKWSQQITKNDSWNLACIGGADRANCPESNGPDFDFGSSPMLIAFTDSRAGVSGVPARQERLNVAPVNDRLVVVGQKSGFVHALDPDNGGRIVWSTRVGRGGVLGGVEWGTATDGTMIYAGVSDVAFKEGGALDPSEGGGLVALRATDGTIVWKAAAPGCGDRAKCSPAQSAAVTAVPGAVFSGSVDGHMRAYDAASGRTLWDVDTAREFETVNHVRARGGSIDYAGPTVVDGVVLLTSGYGLMGGATGNVLIAFTPGAK
jgi:polyvinyl alcohol dehydrogenase (cytochrome)